MINDDPQIEAQKKHIKMELILKDSDLKKNERKKVELEVRIRDLKHKKIQIETELAKCDSDMKKTMADGIVLQNEMKKLKNALNLL